MTQLQQVEEGEVHFLLLLTTPQPGPYFAFARRLLGDAEREKLVEKGEGNHFC